jgi:hypothetical protein
LKDAVYKWTELALKNWAVILPILLFLGSAAGWTASSVDNANKEDEKNKAIHEVTTGFQAVISETEPVEPCDCEAIAKKLIKQHSINHRSEH